MSDDLAPDRRRTFDEAARSYDQARPRYPEAMFDLLSSMLPEEPRVLEIGPGTGQATEPMLRRGARVKAIELGPRLAVVLAQRLGDYLNSDQLEVVIADYENLEPEPRTVDVVMCATAYHWISASEQLKRPPRWLVSGGRLAVVDTMQVASDVDGGYFDAAQPVYQRFGQAGTPPSHDPDSVEPPIFARMKREEACGDLTLHRYRWDQTYTAETYRDLLNTYSSTLAMPLPERTAMVDELVQLVDDRGGEVVRPLVITLATCTFVA